MKPYYEDESCTIYHGDMRDLLAVKADIVVTDPPYGIGEKWSHRGAVSGKNGSSRLWGKGEKWDDAPPDTDVLLSVIGQRPAIVWGGNYFGLPPSGCWLIWDKGRNFTGADAELAWTNLKKPTRSFQLSRIDAYVNSAESVKQHPTEKPLKLMRWCLGFVPDEGTIFDPFMGSGTTLRAAKDLGRKAIGIEIEERYCEIAARRLGQEVFDLGVAA